MEHFNSKNKIKTKWTWITMLLIGMLIVGITSCNDDDDDEVIAPDIAESGWILSFSQEQQTGSINYMSMYEEMPEKIDASSALELGADVVAETFGENVYTVSGSAGTITKWDIDKTTLEFNPTDILSIASAGFSNFNTPVFLSENQAFVIDLNEGSVVEWNPETMEITEAYNVTPNPMVDYEPGSWTRSSVLYPRNGKIFIPIRYGIDEVCCDLNYPGGMVVGVFDPVSKSVEYKTDIRSFAGHHCFKSDEICSLFFALSIYYYLLQVFHDHDDQPFHTVLKFDENGDFDPNFELKLDDILPLHVTREVVFASGENLVCVYIDTSYVVPPYDDRYDMFSAPTHKVSINVNTKEVTPFTALSQHNSLFKLTSIDGVNYINGNDQIDGEWVVTMNRENSFGDYSKVTVIEGGFFQNFNKLW